MPEYVNVVVTIAIAIVGFNLLHFRCYCGLYGCHL